MESVLQSNLPLVTVFFPFIIAILTLLFIRHQGKRKKQRKLILFFLFMGIAIMGLLLFLMLLAVLKGNSLQSVFWPQMIPFELKFRVDGLSITMAILSFFLWSCVAVYSFIYIKNDRVQYYALLFLLLGATQDAFFAIDLVNFYLFLEMTTIITYLLVIHNKDSEALQAGYKYLIISLIGAFLVFLSILFAYRSMGNFKMANIITCGESVVPILFLMGCFIKAGAVPFHIWLPEAHPAAPSPISAFLSGIMIKIGLYGIIRVLFVNSPFQFTFPVIEKSLLILIMIIGIISMFVGVFLALIQTDVKRLLAYSSISQIGYILLGIGLGNQLGLTGALYHIINHAAFKGLLFLGIGAVIYRVGSRKLTDMGGLWKKMPITTLTCIIAALSISGIPPFNGFASKMLIGKAAGEYQLFLKYLLMTVSALTFAYFFKLIKFTFFGRGKKMSKVVEEVPLPMVLPMIVLSVFCLILGVKANTVYGNFLPISLNQVNAVDPFLNIKFWTQKMLNDTLWTVLLGFALYGITSKIGLIGKGGKDGKKVISGFITYLSIDLFYSYLAGLLQKMCRRIARLYSDDLNMHLSWIVLMVIVLYLIFQ